MKRDELRRPKVLKEILKYAPKVIAISTVTLILSACGGGSSTEWGIDYGNVLPQCSTDPTDPSASILVANGTRVQKAAENTTIRIWHYANGDKQVCTITGKAMLAARK